ncbi:hypothetical protein [Streptomyces niveus]|uniref:hypothetical protein n=1 Tax=Streptomyces niveus TaxID=193462 RepID=UPI003689DB0E
MSTSRRRAVSWPRRRCLSRRSSSVATTDTERSWVSARAQENTSTLRRTACGTGRRAVSATARALYRRPYRRTRRQQRESGAPSARDSGRWCAVRATGDSVGHTAGDLPAELPESRGTRTP